MSRAPHHGRQPRRRAAWPTLAWAGATALATMAAWGALSPPSCAGAGDPLELASPAPAKAPLARALGGLPTAAAEVLGGRAQRLSPPHVAPRTDEPSGAPARQRLAGLALQLTSLGLPLGGQLHVLDGPGRGRTLPIDAQGRLLVDDLHPGRALFEIETADGSRCQRELLLRHARVLEWNLDLGHHGWLTGTVQDDTGRPLPGARVTLDGEELDVDGSGCFRTPRWASGAALLELRHQGRVTSRVLLPTRSGDVDVPVQLAPSGSLELTVVAGSLPASELILLLVPHGQSRRLPTLPGQVPRAAPPAAVVLRDVIPGLPVRVDDLPACRMDVLVWHPHARGLPTEAVISPGRQAAVDIVLKPTQDLTGQVLRDGRPLAGLEVTLTWPDPSAARRSLLGRHADLADQAVLPWPPQLGQRVRTDDEGRFALGRDARLDRPAWISVHGPQGQQLAQREVGRTTTHLELELGPSSP